MRRSPFYRSLLGGGREQGGGELSELARPV
jgi:hypothetical protein